MTDPASPGSPAYAETLTEVLDVVSARTGYGLADLAPSFALEADLGVATVQAEILAELLARSGLPRDAAFRPSDRRTLDPLARYLHARRSAAGGPARDP